MSSKGDEYRRYGAQALASAKQAAKILIQINER